jgi:hypothetical protein
MAPMWLAAFALAVSSVTEAFPQSQPFRHALRERQDSGSSDALTVDLGYGVYQGYSNSTTGINTWRGYDDGPSHVNTYSFSS